MSVITICDQGFVTLACRCSVRHPIWTQPCAHDNHEGLQSYKGRLDPPLPESRPMSTTTPSRTLPYFEQADDDVQLCPRCRIIHLIGDFRGDVCGWCADDLEKLP